MEEHQPIKGKLKLKTYFAIASVIGLLNLLGMLLLAFDIKSALYPTIALTVVINLLVMFFGIAIRIGIEGMLKDMKSFVKYSEEWKSSKYITEEFTRVHQELFNLSNYFDDLVNYAQEMEQLSFRERTIKEGDRLGAALSSMGIKLRKSAEEDQRTQWANAGLANFSSLFRKTDHLNISGFCDQFVSDLAKYINANQVAIHVTEQAPEGYTRIVMKGSYAYGRKKFMEHEVRVGEGLVGQAYLERKPIYLKDVPSDFCRITSGLGEAVPSNVYILPLVYNDEVRGVLEIASFHIFEDFEMAFVQQLGEEVAAMIDSRVVKEHTNMLLEESMKQKQELEASEEELRQNIEEMQATQEELERMKREEQDTYSKMMEQLQAQKQMVTEVLDEVEGKVYIKDHEGKFYLFNKAVLNDYGVTADHLRGRDDSSFFEYEVAKGYWDAEKEIIQEGKTVYSLERVEVNEQEKFWLITKLPMKIPTTGEIGLLGIQREVTSVLKGNPGYIDILKKQYPSIRIMIEEDALTA